MFGIKKKTEVFMTNDLELYTTVHQAPKAAQIPCEVKIVNTGTQNRRTGTLMGRVGERPEPVSYTHLDVYKRQLMLSVLLGPMGNIRIPSTWCSARSFR